MNILIVYASIHHGNTKEIAEVINEELEGEIASFNDVGLKEIKEADLVGFGSGIYLAKFHKGLLDFIKKFPQMENKKTFLFSTAGVKQNIFLNRGHESAKKILKDKGFKIVGEFDCLGRDSYGPLKIIGGINKGRPDEKDKMKAKMFARKIKNKHIN